MNESVLPAQDAAGAGSRPGSYFEQRIFELSPVGTLATSLCIFLVFAVTYLICAWIDRHGTISFSRTGLSISSETRGALTIALLNAVALGLQRNAHLKDRAEMAVRHVAPRAFPARAVTGFATLFGIAFGAVAMFTFIPHPPLRSVTFTWFLLATIFVSVLFSRGAALTRAGNRTSRRFIEEDLEIDLLRIDQLDFIGHSAARAALIWFGVSAVLCLFFTSDGITLFTLTLVLGSMALGVAIFVLTMDSVHRKIRAAKARELERVREQIDAVREHAHTQAEAAQRLHGLIAYEGRISAASEWPFDQTTAVRVGASALILTVPWFGQAIAGAVIEHLGKAVP